MGKLHLEIVTPEKMVVSQEVDIVVVPGALGEFGVLPGHIGFLSGVVPGEVRYSSEGQTEHVVVMAGFAEVSDDRVSILVDAAEKAGDIDRERAKQASERAKERLVKDRGTEPDIDFLRAEEASKRATARIKVSEKAI
jgi:F-type H+-transporting ATPase subunit epsilon